MAQICSHCSRPNPDEAAYCYYDGNPFATTKLRGGALDAGRQPFADAFVFPSGQKCRNFDELAIQCWENWDQAQEVLHNGSLEPFLGKLGRVDLALAARQAAQFPDQARGLDQLLDKLPSKMLAPPKLTADCMELKLGQFHPGEDRTVQLQLRNEGMRLLHGNISCENSAWLTVGEGLGVPSKLFAFTDKLMVPLQVRGQRLRAGSKPLEAQLEIESNGGHLTIAVHAEVPATPFPTGVLAGAVTPRQIAEKAKASPREAASLFETGAVGAWYKDNGWDYPVKIPAASGIAGIQQFFEALGLTAAPKVTIQPATLRFKARPGEKLQQNLEVSTAEKRAVWAHAVCDHPWVQITKVSDGKTAVLRVDIASVPERPGEILRARITVLSNGRQRFVVPVALGVIGPRPAAKSAPVTLTPRSSAVIETPKPAPVVETPKPAPVVDTPMVDEVEVIEIDDTVKVEVVEEVETPARQDQPEPEEVVAAEEVEFIEVEDAAEAPNAPSDMDFVAPPATAKAPGAARRASQAESTNPFVFDDVAPSPRKRKKKDTGIFSKLFGWRKKR